MLNQYITYFVYWCAVNIALIPVYLGVGLWVVRRGLNRQRTFIGSLHSDARRTTVEPHMIAEIRKTCFSIKKSDPARYKLYVARLKELGEWDDGDRLRG